MHRKFTSLIEIGKDYYHNAQYWIEKYWMYAVAVLFFAFIIHQKDVSIGIQLNSPSGVEASGAETPGMASLSPFSISGTAEHANNAGKVPNQNSKATLTALGDPNSEPEDRVFSLDLSKFSFLLEKDEKKRAEKRRKQLKYVREYGEIAKHEAKEHRIPASITLAQGILESNAGESRLAKKNKNHFGIKCFSKTCKKGHCSNFSDDHHKDFFRIYPRPEDSFRSHSLVLKKDRYHQLYKLDAKDYQGWSYGLKKAGYATDKHYAEKLIFIIEDLGLYYYDK